MKLENTTSFPVATMLGEGPNDTPCLTIIVKGTFVIRPGDVAAVAPEQLPILTADEFYDNEEIESVRLESDMAPYKPRADIVLVGRAYAPNAKPVLALDVSLQVGKVFKKIRVFGNRVWHFPSRLTLAPTISEPVPFTVMDLVYDHAFGGIDHEGGQWCRENLIGKGFIAKKKKGSIHEIPLPNLEEVEQSEQQIESWKSRPMPVGFGFYGKQWLPRAALIGDVDEEWAKTRAPKMPDNFSFEFYNGAHPDLQAGGYLRGDESVELINLSPDGNIHFWLPGVRPLVTVVTFREPPRDLLTLLATETVADDAELLIPNLEELPTLETTVTANLDTVCLIPDEGRFYLVWRALYPLRDLETLAVEIAGIRIVDGGLDERRLPASVELPRQQPTLTDLPADEVIEIGLLESTQAVPVFSGGPLPASVQTEKPLTDTAEPAEDKDQFPQEPEPVEPHQGTIVRPDDSAPAAEHRVIEIGLLESTQAFSGEVLASALAAEVAAHDREQRHPQAREVLPASGTSIGTGKELVKEKAPEPLPAMSSPTPAPDTPIEATQQVPEVSDEPRPDEPLETKPSQSLKPERTRSSGDPLERQMLAAAMVYRQRLGQFAAVETTWESLAEQEQRLRTVADALKGIKPAGVRKLLALLADKKMDRVFAAAFALLSISAEKFFPTLVAKAVGSPPETIASFVEAVRLVSISASERLFTPHLGVSDPVAQRFLLEVIGDRRLAHPKVTEFVGKCLLGLNKDVTLAALKAQARLRIPDFLILIRRLALNPDTEIQEAALLDLLLDGKHEAFRVLRRLCNMGTKSGALRYVYLAFNGAKADVPLLAKHTHEPMALIGLGILGFPDAAPILMKLLNSNYPLICQAASHALQIITGAVLDETGASRRSAGALCLSADRWWGWWEENNAKFSAGVRWRRGKAFNPGRCIHQMADCTLSLKERIWAYHEVVIASGQDFPFEPDWVVHEQRAAIHEWETWWRNRGKAPT